ncbi:hypothetical protein [Pseudanabaena sp. ABRG5-3]|nr:hypothetical protein [Pseudanabaena sp. ABRG5-3]
MTSHDGLCDRLPILHLISTNYSNPKLFVEAHPFRVRFHKP